MLNLNANAKASSRDRFTAWRAPPQSGLQPHNAPNLSGGASAGAICTVRTVESQVKMASAIGGYAAEMDGGMPPYGSNGGAAGGLAGQPTQHGNLFVKGLPPGKFLPPTRTPCHIMVAPYASPHAMRQLTFEEAVEPGCVALGCLLALHSHAAVAKCPAPRAFGAVDAARQRRKSAVQNAPRCVWQDFAVFAGCCAAYVAHAGCFCLVPAVATACKAARCSCRAQHSW